MAYRLDRSRRKSLVLKSRKNSQEELEFKKGLSSAQASASNLRDPKHETSDHILLADSVGTRDLATLATLTEDTVIAELMKRYERDVIYTNIGDILIAINPFKIITGLYGEIVSFHHYPNQPLSNLPHVFRISQAAYKSLLIEHKNQCCVISGESGAGKTETAKYLVEHLLSMCKGSGKLEERIMQVNPLLEAFGNAKTVINDNSSRFGKYLDIKFGFYGDVLGASLSEYLLEKSRVVRQGDGERNFHVFYYLFASSQKDKLSMADITNYHYLRGGTSGLTRDQAIDTYDDDTSLHEAYEHLIQCMKDVGFSSESVDCVFELLATVLHLGSIEFEEGDDGYAVCVSNDPVSVLANVSGVDTSELGTVLKATSSVTRGERLMKNYSVPDAYGNRDAIAKAMYGRLFGWIVTQANNLLRPKGEAYVEACGREGGVTDVGILDIFGFENFEVNSFEQLCINIANEQLQFYFNQHIFAWELAAYAKEGIDAGAVSYNDNRDLLDMLLQKPLGIFALLDEESRFPNSTPESLVDKISNAAIQCDWKHFRKIKVASRKKSLVAGKARAKSARSRRASELEMDGPVFEISHYAGKVEYDSTEFLVKNRDNLSKDVIALFKASDKQFLRRLFQQVPSRTGTYGVGGAASTRRKSTVSKLSVSAHFKNSLLDLMDKMLRANPHFIRCIKPNMKKLSGTFEPEAVRKQLLHSGVVETTRIRRDGYAVRLPFKDFVLRYHGVGLSVYDMPNFDAEEPPDVADIRVACATIIQAAGLRGVQIGTSMVFLKYYHNDKLIMLLDAVNKNATIINTAVRVWLAKRQLEALRKARDEAIAAAKRKAEEEARAAELRARIEAEKAAAAEAERRAKEEAEREEELARQRAQTLKRERQHAAEKAKAEAAARRAEAERLEQQAQEEARRRAEAAAAAAAQDAENKRVEAERAAKRKAAEEAAAAEAEKSRAERKVDMSQFVATPSSGADSDVEGDFQEFLDDDAVDSSERQRLAQLAAARRAEEHKRKLLLKVQHQEEQTAKAKARMEELDRIAEEERKLKATQDAEREAEEAKSQERVADIDFGAFSFGAWGAPAKTEPAPAKPQVAPKPSVRKSKKPATAPKPSVRKEQHPTIAPKPSIRKDNAPADIASADKKNDDPESTKERRSIFGRSAKKNKDSDVSSAKGTDSSESQPLPTATFSIRTKKKKAPPPEAKGGLSLSRKAKKPPPPQPISPPGSGESISASAAPSAIGAVAVAPAPLNPASTSAPPATTRAAMPVSPASATAQKPAATALPAPDASSGAKPVESKPGEPRRRKLVRGGNKKETPVLLEFTLAMKALDELDAYLDVQLSTDVQLAEKSIKKEASFKALQAVSNPSSRTSLDIATSPKPRERLKTTPNGIDALSKVLLIGEKSPTKSSRSSAGSVSSPEPVPLEVSDRFASGAKTIDKTQKADKRNFGSENVDPKSSFRSKMSTRSRANHAIDIKGYSLSANDILSMDEAERVAILTRVKTGDMTIDDALNEVIEHQRRQNCSIM